MMLAQPLFAALSFAVTAASQIILPNPTWDTLPAEVSGSARGLHALHVDPAAVGDFTGGALQLRHVGTPGVAGTGALGLGAGYALGPLTMVGGYSWANLPNPKAGRAVLGASLALGRRLRLGVQWQRLQPITSRITHSVVDAGFIMVPHRAITVSLGVDALNAPGWPRRVHMRRALRAGVGLRPWAGDPWITLGADARLTYAAGAHFPDARVSIDVAPYEGLHLIAAWHRRPHDHLVWAGLSLDVFGIELLGAGRAYASTDARAGSRMAWALTLRSRDPDMLPLKIKRHVQVDVSGDLSAGHAAPWMAREAVAMLPARLARLAQESDVAAVTLHLGALDVGYATVDELRTAIARLRASGIDVSAHLQVADTKAYLVAAAADSITMDPVGTLDVRGIALRGHYLVDSLALAGIRMETVAVGRYKTAPDRFTCNGPKEPEREVSGRIVQQLYEYVLAVLTSDRGLTPDQVHTALAAGPLGGAQALRLGLIDALEPGPARDPARKTQGLLQTGLVEPHQEPLWGPAPQVAIIALQGMLVQGGAGGSEWGATATSEQVVRALYRAGHDSSVAGVVLRIDSPGGDVVAAEEVYRAVKAVSRIKPLAVSMGDVAASGGYWAALGAPMIFADPHTLTGSIGIYSIKPDISGLLQKLAVHTHEISAGERAGAGAWERPMTADERRSQEQHLNELYGLFVDRVAQNRHLTLTRAQQLAEGRVYSGADALAAGLIDAHGGLFEATEWVAEAAKVNHDAAVTWQVPKSRPGLPGLLGALSAAAYGNHNGALPLAASIADSAAQGVSAQGALNKRFAAPQAFDPAWLERAGL